MLVMLSWVSLVFIRIRVKLMVMVSTVSVRTFVNNRHFMMVVWNDAMESFPQG